MTQSFGRIERLLVPIDFSAYTDRVLAGAAFMSTTHGASVDLLHVWRPPFALATPWGTPPTEDVGPGERELALRFEQALEGARRKVADLGVTTVQTRLVQGIASRAILDLISRKRFDLIIMGNHGQTGLPQAYVGSVTERVIRSSPIPVLVVPSQPETE